MNVLEYAKKEFLNVSNVVEVVEKGEYKGRKTYVIHFEEGDTARMGYPMYILESENGEWEVNVDPRIAMDIMTYFQGKR